MHFNSHSQLVGKHAFLSASKHSWANYDDEKLERWFVSMQAAKRGTELHELAHNLIRLGVKLPKTKQTLNLYVNDAIGFRMTPEQPLVYSDVAFGTADAISFRQGTLRIHDLKTGTSPVSVVQLEIYGAFFCLEYDFKPTEIEILMRIYQNNEFQEYVADPHDIYRLMDRIITGTQIITEMRKEALV